MKLSRPSWISISSIPNHFLTYGTSNIDSLPNPNNSLRIKPIIKYKAYKIHRTNIGRAGPEYLMIPSYEK